MTDITQLTPQQYFLKRCDEIRSLLRHDGATVRRLLTAPALQQADRDVGANIMLAFRHLEDARMRLGKAMQYMQGGESIYDTLTPEQKGYPSESGSESELDIPVDSV